MRSSAALSMRMPPSTAASASRLCGGTFGDDCSNATSSSSAAAAAEEPRSAADDEHAAGRAAAADVEGREALGTLDLVVTGGAGHLSEGVEHLPRAGRADGGAGADQAP